MSTSMMRTPMPASPLTIVVAMDQQHGIGLQNTLPWRLPEDLAHFKKTTSGHAILMGRKTFDSIGKPLPNRRNIVITRDLQWRRKQVEVAHSLSAALALIEADQTGFIIGGAEIYRQALPLCTRLIVTHIDQTFPCDTFFPELNWQEWQTVSIEKLHSAAQNLDFSFATYQRRSI